MVGEWVALPVLHGARGGVAGQTGDRLYDQVLHPAAHRLLARCDAVLRLPGASAGPARQVMRATYCFPETILSRLTRLRRRA